ncbi:MAG: metallophosphoesterase [Vicinamibacterales bacterium]
MRRRDFLIRPVGVIVTLLLTACGSPTVPTPRPDMSTAVLVGAGDIAQCGSPGSAMTARLLDRLPGAVFTAGDNAYMSGTAEEFQQCYEPTWGRHRSRTRPVPGNHDYGSPGAAPYYAYFGAAAGPAGLGYYAYDAGPWRVVALNTEIDHGAGSPQVQWLRAELTARRTQCTLAILHRPRFTSGINGENRDVGELWNVLYELDVDVAISGHDHQYERFAPQDPAGRPDASRGVRQFVVGTGGAALYPLQPPRPNSEIQGSAFGVLSLTLSAGAYQWEFIPVDGASLHDSGAGICH